MKAKCTTCSWEGDESDLVADEYDSYNMANPIEDCCPECGAYCEEPPC